ncbi:hypothetical protein PM082_006144 [Marasmius tenuissimus]|nr:hypothetical protein PM082_006144 [Marasmius tenuissimus]
MDDLPSGSCSAKITKATYERLMMDDITRLPSVHKRLETYRNRKKRRVDGYPLPSTELTSYAWEFRYLGKDTYYAILVKGQGHHSEAVVNIPRLMRNFIINEFPGDETKKREIKNACKLMSSEMTEVEEEEEDGGKGRGQKRKRTRK